MDSKTPMTDALNGTHPGTASLNTMAIAYNVMLDHARKMESDRAALMAALENLVAKSKKAEGLAWECGCETEDGIHTLLEDSRGDAYREISQAREDARAALAAAKEGA